MLEQAGWGRNFPLTKIDRAFTITLGKLQRGGRAQHLFADFVLIYKNVKLAVIESKSIVLEVGEGVAQAKNYAQKMQLDYAFACNGTEIYQIQMKTAREGKVANFPSPEELWNAVFEEQNEWLDKFNSIPLENKTEPEIRFYQEIAIQRVLEAIAKNKQRLLLTLATGSGKTFIAFQIAWKLFHSRWNLKRDGNRLPRILFLVDRNILATQAFNEFIAFPNDALVRIKPEEIRKKGKVPTNGSIFFTIFQTFASGKDKAGKPLPYFGDYPQDYFDFIIVDECHRGGANDESSWREILEYFSPAVQLGLTATPKRRDNIDTYHYFGEPVYSYSLNEGIKDGFLTPFRVKCFTTTLDDYSYASDDEVLEGIVEQGKVYLEKDFNKVIKMEAREKKRVMLFFTEMNSKEKTIIFCASQSHALMIRDLINQSDISKEVDYCHRVTADEGKLGDQHLRDFQDNDKILPTILTTSHKLSTGVDAKNIRNIVLLRPINSMIEFKQIIGRGTRLFDGKNYFTIYDFVDAYHHFADPEWDGEPEAVENYNPREKKENSEVRDSDNPEFNFVSEAEPKQKIVIKLANGKEIQSTMKTLFFDDKPVSAEEFLQNLYGRLPEFFKNEAELREIWSVPKTRKELLKKLEAAGYHKDSLADLQERIDAEKSDLFDVLEYIADFNKNLITREQRVSQTRPIIVKNFAEKQKEFLDFVLDSYVKTGVEELEERKIPTLLELKYGSVSDAQQKLGNIEEIRKTFISFQKYLYSEKIA